MGTKNPFWMMNSTITQKSGCCPPSSHLTLGSPPKVYHRGKTLWSRAHCDRVFAAKPEKPKDEDWISYSEVRAEYNLTHDQLHNYVKYHDLKRKKVGKYTYILRQEIDAILRPPTLK